MVELGPIGGPQWSFDANNNSDPGFQVYDDLSAQMKKSNPGPIPEADANAYFGYAQSQIASLQNQLKWLLPGDYGYEQVVAQIQYMTQSITALSTYQDNPTQANLEAAYQYFQWDSQA